MAGSLEQNYQAVVAAPGRQGGGRVASPASLEPRSLVGDFFSVWSFLGAPMC